MTSALPDAQAMAIRQEDACFDNYGYVNTLYAAYTRGTALVASVVPGVYAGTGSAAETVLNRVLSRPTSFIANRSSPLCLTRCLLAKALMGCDYEDLEEVVPLSRGTSSAVPGGGGGRGISRGASSTAASTVGASGGGTRVSDAAQAAGAAEANHDNLALDAIVDVAEDLLALSVRRGFGVGQVQQLLLLFQQTFQDIVGVDVNPADPSAEERELESRVAKRLTNRVIVLTSASRTSVAEKVIRIETVTEEVVDAALVAALEAKRDPKGNKKQLQAIEDAIRNLPKLKVEKKVPVEVVEAVEIDLPATFSLSDCAAILDLLTGSLFTHWRLFRQLGLEPRLVEEKTLTLRINDAFPALLPSLAAAMSEAEYTQHVAREQLWQSGEAVMRASFRELFELPMSRVIGLQHELADALEAARKREQATDVANQLTSEEFTRTVEVLTNRANKKAVHSYVPKPPSSSSQLTATGSPAAGASILTPPGGPPSPSSAGATPRLDAAAAAGSSLPSSPSQMRCDTGVSNETASSAASKAGLVLFSQEDVGLRMQKLTDYINSGGTLGGSAAPAPGKKK